MEPKLSMVMPVYNESRTLKEVLSLVFACRSGYI